MADIPYPQLHVVGKLKPDPHWHIGPEVHTHHELVKVLEGRMTVAIGGKRLVGEPGDIFFYRAGMAHEEWADRSDPPRTCYIVFDAAGLDPDLPLHCQDTRQRVRQLMEWVFEEAYSSQDDTLADRTRPLIDAMLNELLYHDRYLLPEMVAQVRQYFQEHLSGPITLDDLAAVVGLTRYHFTRRYKQLIGITPMADLRRTRLYTARYYLLHNDWTLRELAQHVGFKDEFHFSRAFKKQFGIAPNHYRKQQQAHEA